MSKTRRKVGDSKLEEALRLAEDNLPACIQALADGIQDPETSLKEKAGAARILLDTARFKPRIDRELGIHERSGTGNKQLTVVIAQKLDMAVYQSLPEAVRMELTLAAAEGDEVKVNEMIAEYVVVK